MNHSRRFSRILTSLALTVVSCSFTTAALEIPHVETLAPRVYSAGLDNKGGHANCGWVVLGDHTLLIDIPRDIAVPGFVEAVARIAGKPVTAVVTTHYDDADASIIEALDKAGVKLLPTPATRTSLGDASMRLEFIPYGNPTGKPGAAVYVPEQQVLFGGPAVVYGPRIRIVAETDTEAWSDELAELKKLPAKVVVPAYGSTGGPEMLDRQINLFHELRRQVAYRVSTATPLQTIQREVSIAPSFYVWMNGDSVTAGDIQHVYGELTVPFAPFKNKPLPRTDTRPQALILYTDRTHEPEHIEAGLRPVFEATGVNPHFLVDVRGLNAENLAQVQLLVILREGNIYPEGQPVTWMTDDQQKAVADFVLGGGGFLNLHDAMGLYPAGGPYLSIVGGHYIPHGPLERFTTEVVDHDHYITRGVTNFFCADEQHTPPYETNKVHLLLRNVSDDGKKIGAAGWEYEPGKGRVVHLANGHTREALNHPMFQLLMRNSVNWLLRRDDKITAAK